MFPDFLLQIILFLLHWSNWMTKYAMHIYELQKIDIEKIFSSLLGYQYAAANLPCAEIKFSISCMSLFSEERENVQCPRVPWGLYEFSKGRATVKNSLCVISPNELSFTQKIPSIFFLKRKKIIINSNFFRRTKSCNKIKVLIGLNYFPSCATLEIAK